MFSLLKCKHNVVIVFDHSEPELNKSAFQDEEWTSTPHGEFKNTFHENSPEPRGLVFTHRPSVDSYHTGDCITRISITGFIVWLNNTPIHWYSNNQGSCEIQSFASEFITMNQCCEYLKGLRYKLRMMGISVDLPLYFLLTTNLFQLT